jgi:hypothetical protein
MRVLQMNGALYHLIRLRIVLPAIEKNSLFYEELLPCPKGVGVGSIFFNEMFPTQITQTVTIRVFAQRISVKVMSLCLLFLDRGFAYAKHTDYAVIAGSVKRTALQDSR